MLKSHQTCGFDLTMKRQQVNNLKWGFNAAKPVIYYDQIIKSI
jgi:hypothetical protein